MVVIPEEIETVKPKPIIRTLPMRSPFSILATLKISSRIGRMTTNKTVGAMNKPSKRTAVRKRRIKRYPLFLATLLSTKAIAMRLINEVLVKA